MFSILNVKDRRLRIQSNFLSVSLLNETPVFFFSMQQEPVVSIDGLLHVML
jgi:hypothetical protein